MTRSLIINRHALDWTTGVNGDYLPVPPDHRFLVTRLFGGGVKGHTRAAFPHTAVVEMRDDEVLGSTARWLIRTWGIGRVVAIHEKDMILAAELRAEFGLPGLDVATTLRFRDKVLMKAVLAAAGYHHLPRHRALSPREAVGSVDWDGPIVVKNRWGMGSSEVRIVDDVAAADRAVTELGDSEGNLEIEEYIDGVMYHCDSVVVDGSVLFTSVSEYLSPPANFRSGSYGGSFVLTGGEVHDALKAHTAEVIRILALPSGVTHLEFFRRPTGEIVFCEAAARPGGGGGDEPVRLAHGVSLVRAAVEIQCGFPPTMPMTAQSSGGASAGVVWVYHSESGRNKAAPHILDAVPGVVSYEFAEQAIPGVVRHNADYAHKLVISARTRAEFDEVLDSALALVVDPALDAVTPPRRGHVA